jgi:hypothetical protein
MTSVKQKKLKIIQVVRNTHRLFGFFLSLLFFIWCATGFVMMYKEFPSISKKEYLSLIDTIKCDASTLATIQDWEYKQLDSCSSISMYQLLDKTIIKIVDLNESIICLDAHTGKIITPIQQNQVKPLLTGYFKKSMAVTKVEVIEELDQWIPRTKFISHMPIYKVQMNDAAATTLYLSSKSGEILQKLTFEDKVWAWLGPIPHWIYFKDLRINTDAWRFVVISLSLIGVLLALLGIVIGRNNILTPFKKKWFRWHHYLGFTFGLFIFTWIFSGLLSMNPFKWSSAESLTEVESTIWKGGNYSLLNKNNQFQNSIAKLVQNHHSKEIKITIYNGDPYMVSYMSTNEVVHSKMTHNSNPINRANMNDFKSMILKLKPNNSIIASEELTDYDDYYYNKDRTLPLPIYRFKTDDPQNSYYYVNPKTLSVDKKMQTDNKIERWLYNGLHSFDFPFLFFKRPLWDIVVGIFLLGCTLLSVTGLKLTINKILKKKPKKPL